MPTLRNDDQVRAFKPRSRKVSGAAATKLEKGWRGGGVGRRRKWGDQQLIKRVGGYYSKQLGNNSSSVGVLLGNEEI